MAAIPDNPVQVARHRRDRLLASSQSDWLVSRPHRDEVTMGEYPSTFSCRSAGRPTDVKSLHLRVVMLDPPTNRTKASDLRLRIRGGVRLLTDRISRRQALAGAGATAVVGAAALVLPASPAAADEQQGNGLLGTWLINRKDNPSAFDPHPTRVRATISFAGGGVFLTRDVNPPSAPGQGAWARTGESGFVFSFLSGEQGPPPGGVAIVKVKGKGTFEGDHISGSYSFTVTDGSGHLLVSGTGKILNGTRMEATG
jgi:hypothetical protein